MPEWKQKLKKQELDQVVAILEKVLNESKEAWIDLNGNLAGPGAGQALALIASNNDKVQDALDLVNYVKEAFEDEKVYAGH